MVGPSSKRFLDSFDTEWGHSYQPNLSKFTPEPIAYSAGKLVYNSCLQVYHTVIGLQGRN